MRETNFAFPAQNRACVCITSQLYDRRALDTTSPLPLFNSLTHLTYLTSTSPRIREIMTADGGLERLVRMLHDFCMCPPPPENPAAIYGLAPPASRPLKLTPTLNPVSFDKHAAYRFSLAFQCVVNIGVRGSESIRRRVVQAGTLEVVGCILEAWLANKGFAVGPAASATGLPRESREQRLARRQALQEQRTAENLTRALQRSQAAQQQETAPLDISRENTVVPNTSSTSLLDISSADATPPRSSTHPTTRDRSGTIVASEQQRQRLDRERRSPPSTDNSRPETETEDDDVDMRDSREASGNSSPSGHSPAQELTNTARPRRQVTIVSDSEPEAEPPVRANLNADAHIIINAAPDLGPDGGVLNVDDGITGLDNNDDFAMGAPPGAPGAIDNPPTVRVAPDITPRAGTVNLPPLPATAPAVPTPQPPPSARNHTRESSPYRDEDVLLSLQLLAYLSKYPHVRQYFYKQRASFHPASLELEVPNKNGSATAAAAAASKARTEAKEREASSSLGREGAIGFLKSFAGTSARGKEKEKAGGSSSSGSSTPFSANATVTNRSSPAAIAAIPTETRKTNVFSLVERFTFRPSSSEADLPNPPPKLPTDIQYWAGVIMRNACRKDDSRGGIRQCANMLCGKWESYPREFAKCRRCRKAKYCGKECQSSAWSEGHRFWCSARDGDEEAADQSQTQAGPSAPPASSDGPDGPSAASVSTGVTAAGASGTVRARHRQSHPHIGASVAGAAPAQHQHTHGDHQHYHHDAGGARGADANTLPQPLPGEILVATLFPNTNQQQQQQRPAVSRRAPGGAEAPLLYLASPPPGARAGSHRAGQPEADTSRNTGMIPVPYAVYTSQAARGAAAAGGSRTVTATTTSTSSQETARADNNSVLSQTTPTQMQLRSNNPPLLNDDSATMRGIMMDHDMSVS